jgi:hypothetical protein
MLADVDHERLAALAPTQNKAGSGEIADQSGARAAAEAERHAARDLEVGAVRGKRRGPLEGAALQVEALRALAAQEIPRNFNAAVGPYARRGGAVQGAGHHSPAKFWTWEAIAVTVTFQSTTLMIDGRALQMQWPVLDAREQGGKVFVLLDPNAYLVDPIYKAMHRQGAQALRNLLAFDKAGTKLWEADFPEISDYYYRIGSVSPLIVNSFSSFRCHIDPNDGSIQRKEFLK